MNLLLRLRHQHGEEARDDHDEIHDVPGIPQVRVRVEDKTHRDNLGAHLDSEDSHEVRLQLLQLQGEDCLVSVGQVGVHGHDHTVGHDGQDDAVLERSAVDKPLHQSSKMCQSIEK